MSDIRITWSPEMLRGDILFPRQRTTETALAAAVAVSLLTHRTAEADDELPNGTTDRKGWWGDHEARDLYGGTPIGSRLWLLVREKQTEETRRRADEYIREALEWVTADRLAERVDVNVFWFAHERLGAEIVLWRGAQGSIAIRFERLWAEVAAGGPAPPITTPADPPPVFGGQFAGQMG